MAGEIYRKILSKAKSSSREYLAISASANGDDRSVYIQAEEFGNDLQLWERRSTRNGQGYALINKERGLCIARGSNENGTSLYLASVDYIERDDLAVWRDDTVGGTWNAINSFADWEQKINIPGNGPYGPGQSLISWEWDGGDDNELWVQLEDQRTVTIESIDFDLGVANLEDRNPIVAASQIVNNYLDKEQTQTLTFRLLDAHAYRFEHKEGLEVSESIEYSAGIPEVDQMKVAISVKGTWEYTTAREQVQEAELTLSVPVTIPPNSSVRVSALLLQARLDVPYKVVFWVAYPGREPIKKTASGIFTGVNSYTSVTNFEPLGRPVTQMERRLLRKL